MGTRDVLVVMQQLERLKVGSIRLGSYSEDFITNDALLEITISGTKYEANIVQLISGLKNLPFNHGNLDDVEAVVKEASKK